MSEPHDHDPKPADMASPNPSVEGGNPYHDGPQPRPQESVADGDELILGQLLDDECAETAGSPSPETDGLPTDDVGVDDVGVDDIGLQGQPVRRSSEPARPRRVRLPLLLFIATCLSTFWVGANHWLPIPAEVGLRQTLLVHWQEGLIYMGCVLAILFAHEMGHFLATVRYGIPASFPFFIPFPISPIGTMGAVIGMDGLKANRRELFDIGLAGPLAGLLVAIPVMWIGVAKLDFSQLEYGPFALDLPLLARMALHHIQPPGYGSENLVWFSHLNPYFMAGWVGFLITGLNMIPVSQLDGGHVAYTLLGRKAHWLARLIVVVAILQIVFSGRWTWSLMILLVLFIGPDHPPTRDDNVPLGRVRTVVGFAAILIPVFCFPIRTIILPN